jgi:hypothetical protein
MEAWRVVFRNGFAPGFSTEGLTALKGALERDDPKLTQGSTTTPPPLMAVQDWPVEAACPVSYTHWRGGNNPDARTVGEVEEAFARACFDADQRVGEAAGCRWLLNWVDDTPRDEMRRELLLEVKRELEQREAREEATAPALVPAVCV